MDKLEEYKRFKSLLEYFVAHLSYRKENNVESIGYERYIKPLIDNKNSKGRSIFLKSGEGYNGGKIQNQISDWDTYKDGKIGITVRGEGPTIHGNYLHWLGTRETKINIISNWEDDKIKSLSITYSVEKEKKEEKEKKSIDELGLFKDEAPNETLIDFFNSYVKLLDNYKTQNTNDMDKTDKKTILDECVELLKNNHNLILTGAPGTGKTYLAHRIAKELGATKENGQCEMVQFHPSYDYTDFVEGLRPTKDDKNGNIGFNREDGVFKEFCKKALKNYNDSNKTKEEIGFENQFKEAYNKFIEEITEKNIEEITLKSGIKCEMTYNNNKFHLKPDENEYSINYETLLNTSKDINFEKIDSFDNVQMKDINSGNNSYIWAVLKPIYEIYKSSDTLLENTNSQKIEKKNYIFIIDEINRGELSKIFGELFFSIDPGYRGEKGKINTQYQNLLKESGDEFEDGFYVPENVYIIGTMNDIDRSVESMDFAMRRRFAWKEVTAESRIEMLNDMKTYIDDKDIEEAKNRLRNLNTAISETEGLNSAYHIGPAYFLKLRNYINDTDGGWNSLWENHIKGLLYEYLRGYENLDEKIEKLQEAYENDTEQTTACKEQRRKFWDNFINYSKKNDGLYKDSLPSDGNWIQKRVFTGGVNIKVVINQNKCYVELEILTKSKDDNKNIFDTLEKNKSDIQKEFDDKELKWLRMDNNKTSKIRIAEQKLSYIKQEDEESIFKHLFDTSQLAKDVFTNYGKVLNLSPNDE